MKFKVTRTSSYNEKPCDEASLTYEPYVDHQNFKTPEDHDKRFLGSPWFSRGTNHRIIDGTIARDLAPTAVWCVQINSLKQLVEFSKKYGELVLKEDSIEIYDTWRE